MAVRNSSHRTGVLALDVLLVAKNKTGSTPCYRMRSAR